MPTSIFLLVTVLPSIALCESSLTIGVKFVLGSHDIAVSPVIVFLSDSRHIEGGGMIAVEFPRKVWNQGQVGSGIIPSVVRVSWYTGFHRECEPHSFDFGSRQLFFSLDHKRFAGSGLSGKDGFVVGLGQTWTLFTHDPKGLFKREIDPVYHIVSSFYMKQYLGGGAVRLNLSEDYRFTPINLWIVPFGSGDSGFGDCSDELESASFAVSFAKVDEHSHWEIGVGTDAITDRIVRNSRTAMKEESSSSNSPEQSYECGDDGEKARYGFYKTWGPGGYYEGKGPYKGIGLYRAFLIMSFASLEDDLAASAKLGIHGHGIKSIQDWIHDTITHDPRFPSRYRGVQLFWETAGGYMR